MKERSGQRSDELEELRRELSRQQKRLHEHDRELTGLRRRLERLAPLDPSRWSAPLRIGAALLGRIGFDAGWPTPFLRGARRRVLEPRAVLGWLDEPAEPESVTGAPTLPVRGWLVGRGATVRKVIAVVGEHGEQTLRYGLVRPDVVRALEGGPGADRSGFIGPLSLAGLPAGQLDVTVQAELSSGERVRCFAFRVELRARHDAEAQARPDPLPLLTTLLQRAGDGERHLAAHAPAVLAALVRELHGDLHTLERELTAATAFGQSARTAPARTGSPPRRLKILAVSGGFPSVMHGGGLTLFDLLSELATRHEVDLYAGYREELDRESLELLRPRLHAVRLTKPYALDAADLQGWLAALGRRDASYDAVHFFYPAAVHLIRAVGHYGARRFFTLQECAARRSAIDLDLALKGNRARVGVAARELLHNVLCERSALTGCTEGIAYTEDDAAFAERVTGVRPRVLPIGVSEHAILAPLRRRRDRDAAIVPRSAAFLGYYEHSPNVDAMKWYLESIHFAVLREVPGYRLFIVGHGDLSALERRYRREPSIEFVGAVDDLIPQLLRAKVCIAPLITGAGFRGKINQYAAAERPTVATSLAASGLPYRHGHSILIADSAEAFARETATLLSDGAAWQRIRREAARVCAEHFRWPQIIEGYEALYRG